MSDGRIRSLELGFWYGVLKPGRRMYVELAELRGHLSQDAIHAYARVLRVFDTDVVTMEINGGELRNTVTESSGVEVCGR